jgi:uncharacterized protein (TIGR02147 family)
MNSLQLLLNEKYLEMKAKNPRLSHRYFAQKLGLSSGALSEILKGKRNVSTKLAAKIAARLHLDPTTTASLTRAPFEEEPHVEIDYMQLRDDQFHMISDWPHFAILNLVKSDFCEHKATWFADQLNLPLKVVQECIDRLLRLKMLSYERRKYMRTQSSFKTSDDILNLSIRKSNFEDLEMMKDHLQTLGVHERDHSSVTMLVDSAQMPDIKKWLRRAQDQFAHKFETTKSKSAFRLTFSLFPLTKPKP